MSYRIAPIAPLCVNTTTGYYEKMTEMVYYGNDKQRRKAERIASQQVELWSQDLSCPWDETSAYHTDYIEDWSEEYHGEASLEYWLDIAG